MGANKKIIIICITLLAIAALGGFLFVHHRPSAPSDLPKNPALLGILVSDTPSSVTVALQGGVQKTFSISNKTQVVSQVADTEVGKSLGDITAGASVLVQPHAYGSSALDSVTLVPASPISNQDPAGPPTTISGTLVATSTDSITVKTGADSGVQVAISKDTRILSNVLAGQKGRTLNNVFMGTYVQVYGIATTHGLLARAVQLLVPLQQ